MRSIPPKMVNHRGRAVVFLRDEAGKRRAHYLGAYGAAETLKAYRDLLAQLAAGQPVDVATLRQPATTRPTVARLVADFLLDAHQHYRDASGKLSREVHNLRRAMVPFLDLLRDRPTDSLTCADLAAVRASYGQQECRPTLDDAGKPIAGTGRTYSRNYVNACMRRILFVCRWGAERGLVPGPVWQTLAALRPLSVGRGGLRETAPVEAIPRQVVDVILPHLPATLQAAVELLWWSGMRAGELCNLRMRDVERGGAAWIYRPQQHKGAWKGRDRVVYLGPRCQQVLQPLLKADPDAFVFRPVDVLAERKALWRAARKTRVQPSQIARDERNSQKPSRCRKQFDSTTLRASIHRACDQAGVERFGLHRLRHAAGTRLVLEAGDDAARLQLGHADGRMVRRYSRAANAIAGEAVAVRHA